MLEPSDITHLRKIDEELYRQHKVGPLRIANAVRKATKRQAPERDAAIMARIIATASKLGVTKEQARLIVVRIAAETALPALDL